jgi:hypothetical protein
MIVTVAREEIKVLQFRVLRKRVRHLWGSGEPRIDRIRSLFEDCS